MTTTFGDLIRSRRQTLTLTPAQLAHRMNGLGHPVDILALEDGHPTPPDGGFINALAAALEWRVGTLRIARDFLAADPERTGSFHATDEETMVRAELDDLTDLLRILVRWSDDLTHRASDLRPSADQAPPRFEA